MNGLAPRKIRSRADSLLANPFAWGICPRWLSLWEALTTIRHHAFAAFVSRDGTA